MLSSMDCACKGANFDKMLQPSILLVLYKQDMHGFALVNELGANSMFNGNPPDKAGVYRYLKKMEEAGLLTSYLSEETAEARKKRIYSITDEGRYCLLNWYRAMEDYVKSVNGLITDICDAING